MKSASCWLCGGMVCGCPECRKHGVCPRCRVTASFGLNGRVPAKVTTKGDGSDMLPSEKWLAYWRRARAVIRKRGGEKRRSAAAVWEDR